MGREGRALTRHEVAGRHCRACVANLTSWGRWRGTTWFGHVPPCRRPAFGATACCSAHELGPKSLFQEQLEAPGANRSFGSLPELLVLRPHFFEHEFAGAAIANLLHGRPDFLQVLLRFPCPPLLDGLPFGFRGGLLPPAGVTAVYLRPRGQGEKVVAAGRTPLQIPPVPFEQKQVQLLVERV
jgi:hypothetical protein